MAIQTATTGALENAQGIIIAECMYTAESQAPVINTFTKYTLTKGNKSITVPKVGQFTAAALTDGIDLIDSQAIGLTYTELTSSEVGLKFILTDKLLRQFNEDVFKVCGRQAGDGMARKKDRDGIALFSALNGGTVYGADNKYLTLVNASACIGNIRANKAPSPIVVVHAPTAIAALTQNAAGIGTTYFPGIQQGLPETLLRNFWKINVDGVNFYWDANIDKISGYDSGYGAIYSKTALAYVEEKAPYVERERDASLRAWEVVMVSDYGVFEIEDTYGAPMQYEIGTQTTTN